MTTQNSWIYVLALCISILVSARLGVLNVHAQPASEAPQSADPAAIEFLLAAAAEDFRSPRSSRPTAIRNARVGYFPEAGTGRYLLCGRYQSSNDKGSEWVQFATIKTSPYEQWIGGMAEAQCSNKRIKWYRPDHAKELMQRVRQK